MANHSEMKRNLKITKNFEILSFDIFSKRYEFDMREFNFISTVVRHAGLVF